MEVKFLPKGPGIYLIQNLINNKSYIGSSVNICNRLWKHRSELRGDYHTNSHLQKAWNKYGEENFTCSVLLLCDCNRLLQMEQKYIDIIKPEYNLTVEVIRNKLCQESIEKMRRTIQELWDSNRLTSATDKEVHQYAQSGEYLQTFTSIQKAAKAIGCHRSTIDRAIHGKPGKNVKTGAGFQWRLQKYESINALDPSRRKSNSKFCRALEKQEELLETPKVDNQQPS